MIHNIQTEYIDCIKNILENGTREKNRTGIDTLAINGVMLKHDMSEGFPLMTMRKLPIKSTAAELEFFIKGLTDKKWLQDRGCGYWDLWGRRDKIPYAADAETKQKMYEERDLGPLGYSFEWRNFGGTYRTYNDFDKNGVDQLKTLVETLKHDPENRRMIVCGWNPQSMDASALNCCHILFNVGIRGNKLDLGFYQRSVDIACNQTITTYALLLKLLVAETNLHRAQNNQELLEEGELTCFWFNTHAYVSHIEGLKELISRQPRPLPQLEIINFTSIFDWQYTDIKLTNYNPYPSIKFEVAV